MWEMNPLEERGETFSDSGFDKDLFKKIHKVQNTNEKLLNWISSKFKKILFNKYCYKKEKTNYWLGENISKHLSDKGLLSKI